MKTFRDCLGREIKVGDVIADGHRDRNLGGITVGIVREMTDDVMKVDKLQRGKWYERPDGSRWWWSRNDGDAWRIIKGRCSYGERCFITGMSEADLRKVTGLCEWVLKDEEKP